MKKLKSILSPANERKHADQDKVNRNVWVSSTSQGQTPNALPPAVSAPSSTPLQRTLNNNAALVTFPSAMIQTLPGPNTSAQVPAQPTNPAYFPQQPQQFYRPRDGNIQTVASYGNQNFNSDRLPGFRGPISNQNAASHEFSSKEGSHPTFCRWCDRCKFGIPYNQDSYICLECKYWICHGCRNVHTTLHTQQIKVEMRQWINFSNEYAPKSTCNQCSTVKMARLQCRSNNCTYSLCVACFHVSIYLHKFFKDHIEKDSTHKEFIAIYPDEWRVTETWRTSPCKCYEAETVGRRPAWGMHCEKCHDPIEIGSNIYWCRDCRQFWGFGQWICEPCFDGLDEHNMQHKQKHYFIKALTQEDHSLPDTHKERFFCPICHQWVKETDYAFHGHNIGGYSNSMSVPRNPDLYFIFSPKAKDWSRLSMYQNCDKELVTKNSYQHFDEVIGDKIPTCMMCQFLVAYNQKATICIKGNCHQWIYCASCTKDERVDHRHKDATYIVKFIRTANLPVGPQDLVQCYKCRRSWFNTSFAGLFCNCCKTFAVCWQCIGRASRGPTFELPGGLPHQNTSGGSSTCTGSDWLLAFEPAQGLIRT